MDVNAYQALRERAAWIDLTGRGKIRVTGEDRARLLHAMSTNHVQQLQPGMGCYGFFLTAQGRIIADVNIFAMPDYLLLDTEPETKQRVLDHLDKFIIADDVALHDFTAGTVTIAVEGPQAETVLKSLGAMPAHVPESLVEWNHSYIAHCCYTGGPGYAVYVPAEHADQLKEDLRSAGVPQAGLDVADVIRIENGYPRYGADFTDAQIPQETGQQTRAIHFAKGCYLGQEIVERVRSRGHVNRSLASLEIETGDAPAKGSPVQAEGKDVGEITSAAFSPRLNRTVALGMIRAEALQSGVTLSVNGSLARSTTNSK